VKTTEAIPTVSEERELKRSSLWRYFGFQNISAIYIFLVIFVLFATLVPLTTGQNSFLAPGTWANLFDTQAITVLAAIAVLIPLVTGVFNLAVGAEITFATMLVVVLQLNQSEGGGLWLALDLPWPVAVAIAVACGAIIGFISGTVVTRLKIDSFIATLGMSSILSATTYLISGNKPFAVPIGYGDFARTAVSLGGFLLTVPVMLLTVVAFVAWYVLERTPVGRRMYSAGFNAEGARLAGVNVKNLQHGSLVAGGIIAAFVGSIIASKFGGSATYGAGMLIPALSAVFLGSTQFKGGRFNVWGTVLALYVLALGVQGLLLLRVPDLFTDFFYGVALIGAVARSRWERTKKRAGAVRRATTFGSEAKARLAKEQEAESPVEAVLDSASTTLGEELSDGSRPD
jgi:ribose transport system permease protein